MHFAVFSLQMPMHAFHLSLCAWNVDSFTVVHIEFNLRRSKHTWITQRNGVERWSFGIRFWTVKINLNFIRNSSSKIVFGTTKMTRFHRPRCACVRPGKEWNLFNVILLSKIARAEPRETVYKEWMIVVRRAARPQMCSLSSRERETIICSTAASRQSKQVARLTI